MQIASPTAIHQPSDSSVVDQAHVVSPSKLFKIADGRFEHSALSVAVGPDALLPTTQDALHAVEDMQAGVRALHAVVVPTTSPLQRVIARESVRNASAAINLLREYSQMVQPFGDGPIHMAQVPSEANFRLELVHGLITAARKHLS